MSRRLTLVLLLTVLAVASFDVAAKGSVVAAALPPADATARRIAADGQRAAERGELVAWVRTWQSDLAHPTRGRAAQFAVATAERLRYRYGSADAGYGRVVRAGLGDQFERQARLWQASMLATQAHIAAAVTRLEALERDALQSADTLTALDVILLRAALSLRLAGATEASAVLARGEAMGFARDPALAASARCRASSIESRRGARAAARRLAREGIAIAERADLRRQVGGCLFVLATDFARSGLSDSLGGPLQAAIALQRETGDLAGLAASSQWAGYYSRALGHFSDAQRHLTTAWDAAQRSGAVDVSAWTALNRAALAQTFFDAPAAALWLHRADSLLRRIDDQQGVVEIARMQSYQSHVVGDGESSRRHLDRAQAAAERLADPSVQLSVLASRRQMAFQNGALREAETALRHEGTLIERFQMSGWLTSHRAAVGELALRQGDAAAALRHIDETLSGLHPSQHRFVFETTMQRALALALGGDAKAAAQSARAAAQSFDRWRASLSDSGLRVLAVQSQRGGSWVTSALASRLAAAGELDVVFELAERRRARDLGDRLLMSQLWRDNVSVRPDRSGTSEVTTLSDVRASIADSATALITLEAGEHGSTGTALIITKQSLTFYQLPSSESLSPLIRRLVARLEAGQPMGTEASLLGQRLLGDAMPHLDRERIRRVVFLPDGVLHRVPFDVLRLADGRHVAERIQTAVAPSASVLARLREAARSASVHASADGEPSGSSRAPSVLALADPVVPEIGAADRPLTARLSAMLFGESLRLPRLPGARDEVRQVQQLFPGTITFLGSRAREYEVKRRAARADVLHFATHAVVDEWSGANAAMALSPGGGDDGMLEAEEIAPLRLPSSLVVLSACRTVGGEVIAGEGVRGLTSAFLAAGASGVIATAWKVDDRAVVPFVRSLYDALAAGLPVSAALQRARLAAIARREPASVWGAFTLVGDPWKTIVSPTARAKSIGAAPPR